MAKAKKIEEPGQEVKVKRKYTHKKPVVPEVEKAVSTAPFQLPTRKEVMEFIKAYGGKAFYSGKKRILYITNPRHRDDIEHNVISQYGYGLPYKLTTNPN